MAHQAQREDASQAHNYVLMHFAIRLNYNDEAPMCKGTNCLDFWTMWGQVKCCVTPGWSSMPGGYLKLSCMQAQGLRRLASFWKILARGDLHAYIPECRHLTVMPHWVGYTNSPRHHYTVNLDRTKHSVGSNVEVAREYIYCRGRKSDRSHCDNSYRQTRHEI